MSGQLQVVLAVLLFLATVTNVSGGGYSKGESGFKEVQEFIVEGINNNIFRERGVNAVKVGKDAAVEWDVGNAKEVAKGKSVLKSNIQFQACMQDSFEACKTALSELWGKAANGKSTGASAKGVYTKCADLKAAVGLEKDVNACA